ncbi:SMC-Scp complex subunit ScpB [Acidobacteriota bacterium]
MKREEAKAITEALIFASPEPVERKRIAEVTGMEGKEVQEILKELVDEYSSMDRGLRIVQAARGYRMTTKPEYHEWVSKLSDSIRPFRLSFAALETLAVVAYKQPITQLEIQEIRGVNSSGVLRTLLERRLLKVVGRKKVVGRPLLYGTSKEFLIHFGLNDLSDLPSMEEFEEILAEGAEPP